MFNEEKTIKGVLTVLNNSNLIDDIIVVDDASTDNSLSIVKGFDSRKLRIINLKKNRGKSAAIKIATENLNTDILFFCDADLRNFRPEHIEQILEPFKENTNIMSVGIRDYGSVINFLSLYLLPLLSGERALPYHIFRAVTGHPLLKNYNLEVVLNDHCRRHNMPIKKRVMKGLHQTAKYKKWSNGSYLLMKQSIQIIIAMFKLKLQSLRGN